MIIPEFHEGRYPKSHTVLFYFAEFTSRRRSAVFNPEDFSCASPKAQSPLNNMPLAHFPELLHNITLRNDFQFHIRPPLRT